MVSRLFLIYQMRSEIHDRCSYASCYLPVIDSIIPNLLQTLQMELNQALLQHTRNLHKCNSRKNSKNVISRRLGLS